MKWETVFMFCFVVVFLARNPLVKIRGLIKADDCGRQSFIFIMFF